MDHGVRINREKMCSQAAAAACFQSRPQKCLFSWTQEVLFLLDRVRTRPGKRRDAQNLCNHRATHSCLFFRFLSPPNNITIFTLSIYNLVMIPFLNILFPPEFNPNPHFKKLLSFSMYIPIRCDEHGVKQEGDSHSCKRSLATQIRNGP